MNIDKSKPMGLRNSGGFDLSGKGGKFVILGGVAMVVILSLLVIGGEMCSDKGKPLKASDEFFVKCAECGKEWKIKRNERSSYQHRERRDEQGHQLGGDCPHCKGEGCAFIMFQCPNTECNKYYLLKQFTDPDKFAAGEVEDVCPHCDTVLKEWYEEHRKKR